ncbi:hypothetical protein HK105_204405 [Polyrhizophydium stewartii]|uniref:GH16 domain-containing protein n=1 Tax=Polyrhizophydium stewartii TaxID=2732419 RepID=A0ABR4N8Y3_9FUNG
MLAAAALLAALPLALAQLPGQVTIPAGFSTGNCKTGRYNFAKDRVMDLGGVASKRFDVDRTQYDFVVEYGSVDYSATGINLNLVKNADATKAAQGVLISTTRYMTYGRITARFNPAASPGVISTLVTWSDKQQAIPNSVEWTQDEIDWEILGKDVSKPETNLFSYKTTNLERGLHGGPIASTIAGSGPFEYTIDWRSDRIDWIVNGNVVKTVNRADSKSTTNSIPNGDAWFPVSASRVQISVWDGSISQANWAGAPVNWNGATTLKVPYEYVDIQCYDKNNQPVPSYLADGSGPATTEAPAPKPTTTAGSGSNGSGSNGSGGNGSGSSTQSGNTITSLPRSSGNGANSAESLAAGSLLSAIAAGAAAIFAF